MKRLLLLFSFFFLTLFFSNNLFAQQGINYKDPQNLDVALTTGYLLPYGIKGVLDTYPFWGLCFGFPTLLSQVEIMLLHGRSKQVIFYKSSIGYRIDFGLFDAIDGFLSLGFESSTYQRPPTATKSFEFVTKNGLYTGFGAFIPIANSLSLRSDFKFSFNPGRSLYVGLGFHYIF